jgi:hypothetical protein
MTVYHLDGVKRLPDPLITCPKCGAVSGDDWSQCKGTCPMTMSPHFDELCAYAFSEVPPPDGDPVSRETISPLSDVAK